MFTNLMRGRPYKNWFPRITQFIANLCFYKNKKGGFLNESVELLFRLELKGFYILKRGEMNCVGDRT